MRTRTLTRFLPISAVLTCATIAFASGPPIYVSSLTGEQILQVDGTTGAVTTVFTGSSQFRPDDLTVGPDNLIYVCVPASNRIVRFAQNGTAFETVYDKLTSTLPSPPSSPQGPRFTFDGSLVFNTKNPHTGVWRISGVAGISQGAPIPQPDQVLTAANTGSTLGEGLAITPFGDLLIVDRANNRVLFSAHSGSPPFLPPSVLIQNPALPAAPVLDAPIGIAVNSVGEIFVANGGALNNIRKFTAAGAPVGVVASFAPDRPLYLEIVSSDDMFVGTANSSLLSGRVWKVPATGGSPLLLASLPKRKGQFPPAEGIGVPATSRSIDKTFTGTKAYNYGAHACELDAGACSATITAAQKAPKDLQALLDANGIHAKPIGYLGEEGFDTSYGVDASAGCSPTADGVFGLSISSILPESNQINPRIVRCEGSGPSDCELLDALAYYPQAPILGSPGDGIIKIGTNNFSEFFVVNEALDPNRLAQFCGYLQPLNADGSSTFNAGRTIAVKFRLSSNGCAGGGAVTEALGLISVARIAPDFARMNPDPSGSSNTPPLYRFDSLGGSYIYNLKTDGWPVGTYHVTTTFLTSETTTQSIDFRIVP